jgi:predicted enzyme related to lactoylglutathione lyase
MIFKNAISWFEIPATDIDRAQKYYEAILGVSLVPNDLPHLQMRMFPIGDTQTGVGGALMCIPP